MENSNVTGKWKVLDGSALKLLAVLTMVIDHFASAMLENVYIDVIRIGERALDLYEVMRMIGRISFPLFAFLLVEGFLHTRDVRRYARDLLIFALLSEIPWNLAHSGNLILFGSQNVVFTLLFGLLGLWVIRDYKGELWKKAALLFGILALSVVTKADYGCGGFGFILMLYLLRDYKLYQAVVGCCFLPARWVAGFAFILINMYNGKRGFIRNTPLKYCFYLIYPIHLLLLYWLRRKTIGY